MATIPPERPPRASSPPLRAARRLARVLPVALQRFFEDRCPQHAAGIAYRVLFSLAPLAIVLVSAFGLLLRDEGLRGDVQDAIIDALPVSGEGSADVAGEISGLTEPTSLIGLAALVGFVWAASGMMASIRTGLETAMRTPQRRPLARGKLIDLALVAAAGLLVLALVLASAVAEVVRRATGAGLERLGVDAAWLTSLTVHLLPVVLATGVVLLLYRFVPACPLRAHDALVGALVTAVLLLGLSLGSTWLYDRTLSLSVVFGSLTTLLVFLYSVYLYACALLLGAEVATVWSEPDRPSSVPLRRQLRDAALGLFVQREPRGPA